MTSSYGNPFAAFGQGMAGFDEFVKTTNLFPKNDPSDNSQFYRAGNVNVLEPISVFASSNIEDGRYKSLQYDNYQINCNESSRASMVPSKSMPHFPNFGFNDSRLEVSAESFDWSMVSFSTAPGIDAKLQETQVKYQFEHTLVAPTASAVKSNQESLTYLNQGQCYEIKLKCMKGYEQHQFFKSIIRVVFHERRLQYSEKELMELWKNNRPGERIIDIDIPECCGLINVEVDPDSLNSIGFIWNPSKPTGIFVKIQCISTEFTANKHGGEKGVPLRIKVETYSVPNKGDISDKKLIHCSSCQIKVFKPKGADRKHKRDAEKLLKLNSNDRNQYRVQESCTLLKEMPVEQDSAQPQFGSTNNIAKAPQVLFPQKTRHLSQDMSYNVNSAESLINGLDKDCRDTICGRMVNIAKNVVSGNELSIPFYGRDGNCESDGIDNDDAFIIDNNDDINNNNNNHNGSAKQDIMSVEAARLLLSCIPVVNEVTEDSMHLASGGNVKDMTSDQLAQWLMVENFVQQTNYFETFTGNELLSLGQDDLISICGPAEGIRLYNLLHYGSGKPKLSIYVSFQGVSNLYTTYKNVPDQSHQGIPQAFLKNHLSSSSSLSPSVDATSEGEKMEGEEEDINGLILPQHSFHHTHKFPMLRSVSLSSVRVLPYHNPRNSNHAISPFHEQRRRHNVNSKPRLLSEDRVSTGSRTPNTPNQGLTLDELSRNVFYPIDLEVLSVKNLRDKLSVLFNVPVQQEQQIYFDQFGIQIIASDDHLQTIPNHSKFTSQIIKCRESPNVCDILLKILPSKPSYFQS